MFINIQRCDDVQRAPPCVIYSLFVPRERSRETPSPPDRTTLLINVPSESVFQTPPPPANVPRPFAYVLFRSLLIINDRLTNICIYILYNTATNKFFR